MKRFYFWIFILFLATSNVLNAQSGYDVQFSPRDSYLIDYINGSRQFSAYQELDMDTNKKLQKYYVSAEIFINFKRTEHNDSMGIGYITVYTGDNSNKIPFDVVISKNGNFYFFYNENLYAHYYPRLKMFTFVDYNRRVYKNFLTE